MAEIEIEKKKLVWPWILVVLIIGALVYFLAFSDEEDKDSTNDTTEMVTKTDSVDVKTNKEIINEWEESLAEFKSYIENPEMGLNHEYSNGALLKLIAAVQNKAKMLEIDVEADLNEAKRKAEDITEDPYEIDHANKIRNGGEIIANAINTIQTTSFPNLTSNYNLMYDALTEIKADVKVLNQKAEVKKFFEQAADLLTEMKK